MSEENENLYVTSLRTYAEICDRYELHVEASGIRDAAKRMLHLEAEIARLSDVIEGHGTRVCPFPDADIDPETPCPVCGDLGTFDAANMERKSLCVALT